MNIFRSCKEKLLIGLGALLPIFVLAPQSSAANHTEKIAVDGPTIVGFFPWVSEESIDSDDGTREGIAHLRFALEDLAKCLKGKGVKIYLLLTDRLVFEGKGQSTELQISDRVGCYLVSPGKRPCIVYATAGPSMLTIAGPVAAAKYFNAPECVSDPVLSSLDQDFCEHDK